MSCLGGGEGEVGGRGENREGEARGFMSSRGIRVVRYCLGGVECVGGGGGGSLSCRIAVCRFPWSA